ncbi:OLC1v1011684C3 [Oldenlandia corymbosa var. corymbosa]|uniref:OLC1v1011684C3 n=1 Tax=Oldenlandia corymbosa var. corymbosa TaxID=529605 RepID=A0AAV1DX90_OLDCO|nr:OLC1v1011684C3 [Oldenlandia corymbosa var. corymbosa]
MEVSKSPSLTCRTLTLLTVSAVVIQIIGLSLFVMGFFPVKSTLSGTSGLESFFPPNLNHSVRDENISALPPAGLFQLYQKLSGVPPSFDRLVFMVIDGLPAEFILGRDGKPPEKVFMEAMPYTQSLLAKGKAMGYHAKAAPPTVTMPRLKAMVSGAIGGYLDVAFNFNTQALLDDNLIEQFTRIGWKIVMLGDDTWIKLFPGKFTRHDGVSSFFVKDTVEVDHNVSRHLNTELNMMDWNLLILHYLGLDHIGHIGGRNSLLMGSKLREMDEVIKMIDRGIIQGQEGNKERTLLMIVSDHGMTESGNHGGSSFEETDSLALFVGPREFGPVSKPNNMANQVDIASTLALLFGVPIPKENVGIVMTEVFKSLTVDEQLRVMELNSWQLFKLLQAQSPNLECKHFKCDVQMDDSGYRISQDYGSVEKMFCCLYLGAATAHESLKSPSTGRTEYDKTFLAYHEFLKTASQWLSSRATDRPSSLLVSGLTALLLSCLIVLGLLFLLVCESDMTKRDQFSRLKIVTRWQLDEIFCLAIVCIIISSMGSSSMVEEEQYVWHFVVSSFYILLLRKVIQSRTLGFMVQTKRDLRRFFPIVVILISGRVLRGWHQGGVNWAHLPDISKWLEQEGSAYISLLQLVSGVLLISTYFFALLSSLRSRKIVVMVISIIYLYPALFILYHIFFQGGKLATTGIGATEMVQRFYAILGFSTVGTLFSIPWMLPLQNSKILRINSHDEITSEHQSKLLLKGLKDTTFVSGWCLMFSWSLLQLLLQQPINSMPLFLISIQMMAAVLYSSRGGTYWAEVAAIYYLGIAGHFGLGNTNNLATIDVAGAFIGVSSHSTTLSGILMFIITYASPLLSLLSMVMYISRKDMCGEVRAKDVGHLLKRNLGFPCLVPLGLNSLILNAYTVVLLLMRNHLFIWSVFSPKYLYVCAATVCVIIGVSIVASSVSYTCLVVSSRRI